MDKFYNFKQYGNEDVNNFEKEATEDNWKKDSKLLSKLDPFTSFRQVDLYQYNVSLFKGIAFPEIYSDVRFPAPFTSPTFSFQQKSSFSVDLNANGCAWVEVNMSQFLDASKFRSGLAGSQNGTSLVGNSNVFVSLSTGTLLDGITPLSNATAGIQSTNVVGLNVMQMPTGNFNAVRSGPMSVKYEYTGRLDASSGTVTMGVNHTSSPNGVPGTGTSYAGAATVENGLNPNGDYSTISRIEDCPHARTAEITQSLKAINVPVDYNALNLKDPLDSNNTFMHKRLFILVSGGPVSQKGAARITITANWEGIPSITTQDYFRTSYSTLPSVINGREVFEYMMRENLIVTKVDEDLTPTRFVQNLTNSLKGL